MGVIFDDRDFQSKISKYLEVALSKKQRAVHDVASEILRLSQREVPHDVGTLQNSGAVVDQPDESIVGYNTVYAAYQHEGRRFDGSHVIQHWQKGRKGKYLEDPIKNNLSTFKKYFESILGR